MRKYVQVFKISLEAEFAYKVNFIMWRVRNVLQIFLVFFLWDSIYSVSGQNFFGYDRSKILTYVFGILIVRALVLSTRAIDIAGEISRGDISNYLVKPIDYFKYYFTRDISSKALNIFFAIFETSILFIIIKPPFFLQTNIFTLGAFLLSIIEAILIYFILLLIISTVPFWIPEVAWGVHFLITVILVEFLSGALFPLDILPKFIQSVIYLTPFPYLIFFPIQVYLGKLAVSMVFKGLFVSFFWIIFMYFLMRFLWKKGLIAYQAYGK